MPLNYALKAIFMGKMRSITALKLNGLQCYPDCIFSTAFNNIRKHIRDSLVLMKAIWVQKSLEVHRRERSNTKIPDYSPTFCNEICVTI